MLPFYCFISVSFLFRLSFVLVLCPFVPCNGNEVLTFSGPLLYTIVRILVQLIHVHIHVHNSILLLSPFLRLSLLSLFPFLSLMLVCYTHISMYMCV